ncbi:MAG TPA: histidine kinase [Longimicrobium sp.]|nr:histidine kinase [Longimicrobium sp.]
MPATPPAAPLAAPSDAAGPPPWAGAAPLRHHPRAEWALAAACTVVFTLWYAAILHASWPFGSYCRCSFGRALQISAYNFGGQFVVIPLELAAFRLLTPPRAGAHRVLWTSVVVVLASVLAFALLRQGLGSLLMGPRNFELELTIAFTVGFGVYAAAIAWEMARLSAWRTRAAAAGERRFQADLLHARLATLLSQLHPHFLFNAMNSASSLIVSDGARAREMIERLRELLGIALRAPRAPLVRVAEEMRFLALYLQIEQVRFRDRLRVSIQVAPGAEDALVPQMILQPLVENAVRHGIARSERGGDVRVSAELRGGRWLVLRVEDTGTGLDGGGRGSRGTGGLGLPNTRARLALRYGESHTLLLSSPPGGGTVAEITVPAWFEPGPGLDPDAASSGGADPSAGTAPPPPRADGESTPARDRVPVRALWALRRWWWVFVGFSLIEGTAADALAFFRDSAGANWLVFGTMAADLAQNAVLTAVAVAVAFRWPFRRANALPIAGVLLALLAGTMLLMAAAALVLGVPRAPPREYWASLPVFVQGPVTVLCLAYALRYALASAAQEAETSAVEGALRGAELESLRSQVDREFLMSTLAWVCERIPIDAEAADQALCRLAALLRRILQQTSMQWVELEAELETVRLYLEVKEAQGEAVELGAAVDPALLEVPVPRQLLLAWVMRVTEGAPGRGRAIHVSAARAGAGALALTVDVRTAPADAAPPGQPARHLGEMRRLFARGARFALLPADGSLRLRVDLAPP